MKRVGELIVCFLVVCSIVYMRPVISSRHQPKEQTDMTIKEIKQPPKSVPYFELNATGMATYIGKTEQEFKKGYPAEPKKEWLGYSGVKWLVYGSDVKDYFQVGIQDSVVSSVFVLGSDVASEPFSMNMTLSDLSEITTIYSNFNFQYGDESYELELTEDDMNYRPLVAFNNDSFAMLHLNQTTGKLIGVRYFDKRTLLELTPYQLNKTYRDKERVFTAEEWEKMNQDNKSQLYTIINLLREKDDKQPYETSLDLELMSRDSLSQFLNKPESVLENEDRLKTWQDLENSSNPTKSMMLDEKEMSRLIALSITENKDIHGLFASPVVDVPFLITNWYGNRVFHEELMHKKDSHIGMNVDEHHALILFNDEPKLETTESSDMK